MLDAECHLLASDDSAAYEPQPKARRGRPSTYSTSFCGQVLALGSEGASRAEMAHALGCALTTMRRWEAWHPEFKQAVSNAIGLAQGVWERMARLSAFSAGPRFNAKAFAFQMLNRFPADWRHR